MSVQELEMKMFSFHRCSMIHFKVKSLKEACICWHSAFFITLTLCGVYEVYGGSKKFMSSLQKALMQSLDSNKRHNLADVMVMKKSHQISCSVVQIKFLVVWYKIEPSSHPSLTRNHLTREDALRQHGSSGRVCAPRPPGDLLSRPSWVCLWWTKLLGFHQRPFLRVCVSLPANT